MKQSGNSNGKDVEYYRRRELDERMAAQIATCEVARRAHVELAEKYAALARGRAHG